MATTEERPTLIEMHRRALKAIYRNDSEAFWKIFNTRNKTGSERRRVIDLLLKRQTFLHVEGEDDMEWSAFRALLRFCPEEMIQKGSTKRTVLQNYMKTYRGLIMHVAAALNRPIILLKVLDMVHQLQNRKSLQRILTTMDNQRRSILGVAMDENHKESTSIILSWIFERISCLAVRNEGAAVEVMLGVLPWSTSKVCLKAPDKNNLGNVIRRTRCHYPERMIPLAWPIIKSDIELLKTFVKQRKSLEEQHIPSLLHMTVSLYARELLTPERKAILKYLIDCADLPPTEIKPRLDDICNIEINGCILFNGTAVHFALGWTHQVFQIHPGLETEPHRFSTKESTQSPGKTFCSFQNTLSVKGIQSVIDMVTFLRDQGADLLKPNDNGKSPLACLPPDADPQLLKLFVDFSRWKGD